ncbi:MAG TPA: DUF2254 domain-containing protein [Acidobacteriota bacterium]|nr:DUF2254 domain-containing protein [Acidobacteriota bacterium]
MKTKLASLWESIRTSLWFVPALMVIISCGLAFVLVKFDSILASGLKIFCYTGGPEGARTVLSTIAGSMITIAGVTFSITIVALTMATSQFGSRLLRNFMVDKSNQVVLGAFIATFIYCLLVLNAVKAVDNIIYIPRIAVSFSFVLALANLGILIYFFHHVSTSIQAEHVINSVYKELKAKIDHLFEQEKEYVIPEKKLEQLPDFQSSSAVVCSKESGYLRAIDREGLFKIAVQNNLVIQLKYRAGDYVFTGTPLIAVIPDTEIETSFEDRINGCFLLGSSRSPEQDVEFAIHQLVEVALRALSPGINDPYTAMGCIDRLGDIICQLHSKKFPISYRYDKEGHVRLVLDVFSYDGILDAAFNQIRQSAAGNVAVNLRLLEILKVIAQSTQNKDQYLSVKQHAEMIYRSSKESTKEKKDLKDIEIRFQAITKVINKRNE